jgi:hypothetical protein
LSPKHDSPNPRRWLGGLAALAVIVGAGYTVAVLRDDENAAQSDVAVPETRPTAAPTSPVVATDTAAPHSEASPVADDPGSPATATAALAGFFAASRTLDGQLRAAATAINGAGPPWPTIGDQVRTVVRDAEITPAATAIPAGMPDRLRQTVLVVYSDLVSRRQAMASFTHLRDSEPSLTDDMLLAELGNGHAAALRFDRDLRALELLASSTPAFTVAPNDSRARAEVLLLIAYVDGLNGGCDGRGGEIVTELPSIVWEPITTETYTADGGIGFGDELFHFTAVPDLDGTWQVALNAC